MVACEWNSRAVVRGRGRVVVLVCVGRERNGAWAGNVVVCEKGGLSVCPCLSYCYSLFLPEVLAFSIPDTASLTVCRCH